MMENDWIFGINWMLAFTSGLVEFSEKFLKDENLIIRIVTNIKAGCITPV